MFFSIILLSITGIQSFFNFSILKASYQEFALFSTIFYMFSQSWVMFYFIGAGKTIKETIIHYNLDKSIYQKVINHKRKLFPHLTFNILFIGTVFVIGGKVHMGDISPVFHGNLFIFSLVHYIYTINMTHGYFKETADILSDLGESIEKEK
mgnify:CR=1 FL=1